MDEKKKHEALVIGGVAVGGVVLLLFFRSSGGKQPKHAGASTHSQNTASNTSKTRMVPNPANASIEQQIIAARETALEAFDQSVLGEKGLAEQQDVTNNETAAQKAIAFNQDSTAFKTAGLEATAEETLASDQQQAEEQAISAQQQVQTTQSNNGFWSNLLGGLFSGVGAFLGFSPGSGTGNVSFDPLTGYEEGQDPAYTLQGPSSWDEVTEPPVYGGVI